MPDKAKLQHSELNHSAAAYRHIAKAIEFLSEHQQHQPSLATIANHVGLSESHFQRLFTQWAGVSPKQYLGYLTKEHAKTKLREFNVLQSAAEVGLSGSSRLHDLLVNYEGVTPGEYKSQGQGLRIVYGLQPSPFGLTFIANTVRGICHLHFIDSQQQLVEQEEILKSQWPNAQLVRSDAALGSVVGEIFNGPSLEANNGSATLRVLTKGSSFQLKVWEALLAIPAGAICSYQQLANVIQAPQSVRAVASAVAKNNIGYLIPCHRVIRATGDFNQYRWSPTRKKALLAWEASRLKTDSH